MGTPNAHWKNIILGSFWPNGERIRVEEIAVYLSHCKERPYSEKPLSPKTVYAWAEVWGETGTRPPKWPEIPIQRFTRNYELLHHDSEELSHIPVPIAEIPDTKTLIDLASDFCEAVDELGDVGRVIRKASDPDSPKSGKLCRKKELPVFTKEAWEHVRGMVTMIYKAKEIAE